jgi:hypothetical protein
MFLSEGGEEVATFIDVLWWCCFLRSAGCFFGVVPLPSADYLKAFFLLGARLQDLIKIVQNPSLGVANCTVSLRTNTRVLVELTISRRTNFFAWKRLLNEERKQRSGKNSLCIRPNSPDENILTNSNQFYHSSITPRVLSPQEKGAFLTIKTLFNGDPLNILQHCSECS